MNNTFEEFYRHLSKSPTVGIRPFSATNQKVKFKQRYATPSSALFCEKKTPKHSITERKVRNLKSNHMNYQSVVSTSSEEVIYSRTIPENQGKYRFQVINYHCMKKLTLAPENKIKNLASCKIGQDLCSARKASGNSMIGKRLKCMKKKDCRRLKTQPVISQPWRLVVVKGKKID